MYVTMCVIVGSVGALIIFFLVPFSAHPFLDIGVSNKFSKIESLRYFSGVVREVDVHNNRMMVLVQDGFETQAEVPVQFEFTPETRWAKSIYSLHDGLITGGKIQQSSPSAAQKGTPIMVTLDPRSHLPLVASNIVLTETTR